MPLVKRKQPLKSWQLTSAEVGGMHSMGKTPMQIATKLDLSVTYVADLIDLYVGWKKWQTLLTAESFMKAKDMLRKMKEADLIRRVEEHT